MRYWAQRATSPLWTPRSLSVAPDRWYRDSYVGGGTWLDLSGNGQNTTARATSPVAGTAINGRPTVRVATGNGLLIPSSSVASFSLFMVLNVSAVGYLAVVGNDVGTDGGYLYGTNNDTIDVHRSSVASNKRHTANWATAGGTPKWLVWTYDGTHAGHKLYLGGSDLSLTNGAGTADPGTAALSQIIYLGSNSTGVGPITADYAEVAKAPGVWTAGDVAKLGAYVSALYGI